VVVRGATMANSLHWGIYAEHLDEGAFLFQLWEEALRSPDYTLEQIAAGPEDRLLAHIDGLVLSERPAPEKLLLPALGGDDAGPAFVAAFALATEGRPPDDLEAVLDALQKAQPKPRAAIRRALAIVPRSDLGRALCAAAVKTPAIQADLLEVLGYLRVDAGLSLGQLTGSREPRLEALGVRLARVFPSRVDPSAVDRAFASPVAEVRTAALETGVLLGRRPALDACEATVEERGPGFKAAALLVAMSGEAKSLPSLVKALGDEKFQRDAAFALGFSGRVSAADALLDAMANENVAPVAAEAFAAITGLPLTGLYVRPPKKWDPDKEEEKDPQYGPEADLPRPELEGVGFWWEVERKKLDSAQRWLRGRPWSPGGFLAELESGPARRREALALDLAVRSRGRVQIAWDALAARQRKETREARGVPASAAKTYRELSLTGR
jgi:uncharacterized protein (TIGR02270 family)